MPGEDGYSLLAKLRSRSEGRGRIPAIALTAYSSSDDRARLLSDGFQLHLAKPIDPTELTAAIASVVARLEAAIGCRLRQYLVLDMGWQKPSRIQAEGREQKAKRQ